MDSDSLPTASASPVSQVVALGRQPAPSSLPDESFVCVELRYSTAQQRWQLASTESDRLALIYDLDWLPERVQQACQSTHALPGYALITHISQADYRSIFHI